VGWEGLTLKQWLEVQPPTPVHYVQFQNGHKLPRTKDFAGKTFAIMDINFRGLPFFRKKIMIFLALKLRKIKKMEK